MFVSKFPSSRAKFPSLGLKFRTLTARVSEAFWVVSTLVFDLVIKRDGTVYGGPSPKGPACQDTHENYIAI